MKKEYLDELVGLIKSKKPSKITLSKIKVRLCKKHKLKKIPTDIEVLLNVSVKDLVKVKKYLLSKPTRTISGVAVCAIMTKPYPCPHAKKGVGPCLMCPGGPDSVFGSVPQSYTGKEPATRRAIRNNYDPYLQVMNRLEQYTVQGHIPDKLELIIMGGTFISFPKGYRDNYVMYAFKAMNDFSSLFFKKGKLDLVKFKEFFELPGDIYDNDRMKRVHKRLLFIKNINGKGLSSEKYNKELINEIVSNLESNKKYNTRLINEKINKKLINKLISNNKISINKLINNKKTISLEKEQLRNETSSIRCVSLVIETRPDYAKLKQANEMLRLGCTKVELGVQTIYNDVLDKIKRGHTVEDSIEATMILKDLGFKINYHMMLGLPGVNRKRDIVSLESLFGFEEFQPDMLKLYPCMVLKGTKLYELWKNKKYKPLTTKQAALLIAEFKSIVPEFCRIMRVQRDIPTFMTESGVDKTNLRQYVQEIMKEKKLKCRCIRCREPKLQKVSKKVGIIEMHYHASGGNEFFISAEDVKNDIILGFCRLRFPHSFLRKEITTESALIRELHVYGEAVQIGGKGKIQHKGIGKKLVEKAEEMAKMYFKDKIVVISGVGVREYFKKLGYNQEGPYMVKKL